MSRIRRSRSIRRKSRTPLKWIILITVFVALLAALISVGGGLVGFIEHYFGYEDTTYQPMDTERQQYEAGRDGAPDPSRSSSPDATRPQ
jgi:hypothetical protein